MKRYLLLVCLSVVTALAGCEKDNEVTAVTLKSISRESFDYKGGLANAVIDTGGASATVKSDQKWCKAMIIGNNVNFNVSLFTGSEDRSATITVESGNLTPLIINIHQAKLSGLIATTTSLTFSTNERSIQVAVTASGTYEASFTENPGNPGEEAFTLTKTETGVTFTSNYPAGDSDVSGRAVLTPSEGEPVTISLLQPKKSVYDLLLGTWAVTKNTVDENNLEEAYCESPFVFTMKEDQISFNVWIDDEDLGSGNMFEAEFVSGKVLIYGGQEMGTKTVGDATRYVTLHYNRNNPNTGYTGLLYSPRNNYWTAEPVFKEASNKNTINLVFVKSPLVENTMVETMHFFHCVNKYYNFNKSDGSKRVAQFKDLELTKIIN